MNISMEISMYPLADEFVFAIGSFIERLAARPGIRVVTNSMSTQVFGELDAVMEALREGLRESWSEEGKSVFVLKLINSDLGHGIK